MGFFIFDIQNGTMSVELHRIDVGIVAINVCNRENAYNGTVIAGTLCAGSMFGGRGACPVKYLYEHKSSEY